MVVGLNMTWVVKEGVTSVCVWRLRMGRCDMGNPSKGGKKVEKKKSSEKVQEPTVRINSHSSE